MYLVSTLQMWSHVLKDETLIETCEPEVLPNTHSFCLKIKTQLWVKNNSKALIFLTCWSAISPKRHELVCVSSVEQNPSSNLSLFRSNCRRAYEQVFAPLQASWSEYLQLLPRWHREHHPRFEIFAKIKTCLRDDFGNQRDIDLTTNK